MTLREDTLRNWRGFWRRLEKRKGIQGKTPPYTNDVISWLFRELHGDETYKFLAGWKYSRKDDLKRLEAGTDRNFLFLDTTALLPK